MQVEDSQEHVLQADKDTDNSPFLFFKYPMSGEYFMTVTMHASRAWNTAGFCSLMIFEAGDPRFSYEQMVNSANGLVARIQQLQSSWPDSDFPTYNSEVSETNPPVVIGVPLESGYHLERQIHLQSGRHLFVGYGAPNVGDMDLYLMNTQGKTVASDTKTRYAPAFEYTSPQGGDYQYSISNTISAHTAICWVASLMLPKQTSDY